MDYSKELVKMLSLCVCLCLSVCLRHPALHITGLYNLPTWFLRLGAPVFYKPLTHLFNLSLLSYFMCKTLCKPSTAVFLLVTNQQCLLYLFSGN